MKETAIKIFESFGIKRSEVNPNAFDLRVSDEDSVQKLFDVFGLDSLQDLFTTHGFIMETLKRGWFSVSRLNFDTEDSDMTTCPKEEPLEDKISRRIQEVLRTWK